MQAQFVHDGKAVDFTPTADVGWINRDPRRSSGYHQTRHQGGLARLHRVEGVFEFPKTLLWLVEFEAGTKVYVDEDGSVVADDVGTKYLGKVVTDAARYRFLCPRSPEPVMRHREQQRTNHKTLERSTLLTADCRLRT